MNKELLWQHSFLLTEQFCYKRNLKSKHKVLTFFNNVVRTISGIPVPYVKVGILSDEDNLTLIFSIKKYILTNTLIRAVIMTLNEVFKNIPPH
ncbi:hypothetical protein CVD27_01320 [Neobacillus cucumis]|uniref:Uncharacterized protein n=1 Tax=Neobacillus cucumis TaxID=1740721 RepID=A0A2N5HVF6_9BACI|nr:hypothetical protein CVD27_01320 [Neobacillus cucumis]